MTDQAVAARPRAVAEARYRYSFVASPGNQVRETLFCPRSVARFHATSTAHPDDPSSVCAPSGCESQPHPRSTTRTASPAANAQTNASACSIPSLAARLPFDHFGHDPLRDSSLTLIEFHAVCGDRDLHWETTEPWTPYDGVPVVYGNNSPFVYETIYPKRVKS